MRAEGRFALVGLSHKSASVEVRERLAVATADLPAALARLRALPGIQEALLLSTCNRFELYLYGPEEGVAAARRYLRELAGSSELSGLTELWDECALEHLFAVAASLESMVLGEPQILGQVREAIARAREGGVLHGPLSRAADGALRAAKRVRAETGIAQASVSVASAAVELAHKVFESLAGRRALIVGAGSVGELMARHLASAGAQLVICSRTLEHAQRLADALGAEACPFEELAVLLEQVDVVATSTAAPRPIIGVEMMKGAFKARRHRPLCIIDLAVPRDVEEGVRALSDLYAYDIDDLDRVAHEGRRQREREAARGMELVRAELRHFMGSQRERGGMPVIAALRAHGEEIARAELERTLQRLGEAIGERERASIEAMGKAIVKKLLHAPTNLLREAAGESPDEGAALALTVGRLFALEDAPRNERERSEQSELDSEARQASGGSA